jgi:Bacterial membrane protein YfhO
VLKLSAASSWVRDWLVLNGVTVLSVIALTIGVFRERLRRVSAAALLVLMSAEGIFNNTYPSPDAFDIFNHPVPYVQVLQREAGMKRVLPFGAMGANLNSAFEIFSFDSLMTINPPRAYELYRRYTESPAWLFLREASRIPPEPVLDRAGIGFLAVRDAFPGVVKDAQARGYTVRFNDGYVWLFERPTLPRFLFSSQYRVLRGPAVLNAMSQEPSREILLERRPTFASAPSRPADPEVRVDAYHCNAMTLSVDAPRPGLVYVADSFFDGWTATVNGKDVGIMPANYAFRAVEVPEGRSQIEFRYWLPGLTAGLTVTLTSATLLVALVALLESPRRRAQL